MQKYTDFTMVIMKCSANNTVHNKTNILYVTKDERTSVKHLSGKELFLAGS